MYTNTKTIINKNSVVNDIITTVKILNNEYDTRVPFLKYFYNCLPKKPYCTNAIGETGYLTIRQKETASTYPYVQPNPIHRAYWLIFDLDYSHHFLFDKDNKKIPSPNIEIENWKNQHCHLIYAIDPAIYTLRNARRKPLELAADVDRGLTVLLAADPAYGKLICKNPLSPAWNVYVHTEKLWGLKELLEFIPGSVLKQKKKPREEIGLGRNCMVFEKARLYAYSEWRRLKFADDGRLTENVLKYALETNHDFITPLGMREVKCIARSVSRWTIRHMTSEGFDLWGDLRRDKSLTVRQSRSQTRADEAKTLYAAGKTQQQIALLLGLDQSQISRLLRS